MSDATARYLDLLKQVITPELVAEVLKDAYEIEPASLDELLARTELTTRILCAAAPLLWNQMNKPYSAAA